MQLLGTIHGAAALASTMHPKRDKFRSRHRLVDGGKRDGIAECVRVDHIEMVVLDGIVPSDCC